MLDGLNDDCNPANYPNPRDYAIVVGINSYPELRMLKAAENDATRFAGWLEKKNGGGLCPQHIKLILSSAYPKPEAAYRAQPIRDDIDHALKKFGVGTTPKVGRRLYFYFAGHGLGPSYDDVAMLMANANGDQLNNNIGFSKYRSYFREVGPFEEVVYFLDCCRDRDERVEPQDISITSKPAGGVPVSDIDDFIILASRYDRPSFEPPATDADNERRGVLTNALMEALDNGQASDPAAGGVTALSLSNYVKLRVPKLAGDARLRQAPEIPVLPNHMVFGPLVPPLAVAPVVTIKVTAAVAGALSGNIVLLGGDLMEMDRRSVAALPWSIDLVKHGFYALQHDVSGREFQLDTRKIKNGEAPDAYEF